jgi:bifunctional UDP-N-acetylglucosamine pyrophosphorylase/glucosamine-1-phosphate N-acetyltransferase
LTGLSDTIAIILAGGKGKRMMSTLPKVMHQLAGRPIIRHLTDTLATLGFAKLVLVVGVGRELLFDEYRGGEIGFAVQQQQLGTADAVKAAVGYIEGFTGSVLVVLGDVPLLRSESILKLLTEHRTSNAAVTVLTSVPRDPSGYGRVIRDSKGLVKRIVEDADATNEELQIGEINTGIMAFAAQALLDALASIDADNEQGEYYLTDAVRILLERGRTTRAVLLDDYREGLGVNSIEQLRELERLYQQIKNVDKELGDP